MGDDFPYLVGRDDGVLARTFLHIQHHHALAQFAGIGGFILFLEADLGNVFQVYRVPAFGFDHEIFQISGVFDFPQNPEGAPLSAHIEVAG